MKYILPAFILSILLHLIILYTVKDKIVETSDRPASSKSTKKSAVHFVKLQQTAKPVKKRVKKTSPIKKEKVEKKKLVKKVKKEYKKVKKVVKQAKREVLKEKPKKIERKPITKEEVIPSFAKINPTQLQKQTVVDIQKEPLDIRMLDQLTQSYIKLYGEEYNSFTKVQKVFLQNNLKDIGRITQQYLRYPSIAIRMRQQGMNIIEFVLYPNGDISTPLLTSSSGSNPLDKNTVRTIEIAYKDYPRPKEPTKIKIYVIYKLY